MNWNHKRIKTCRISQTILTDANPAGKPVQVCGGFSPAFLFKAEFYEQSIMGWVSLVYLNLLTMDRWFPAPRGRPPRMTTANDHCDWVAWIKLWDRCPELARIHQVRLFPSRYEISRPKMAFCIRRRIHIWKKKWCINILYQSSCRSYCHLIWMNKIYFN